MIKCYNAILAIKKLIIDQSKKGGTNYIEQSC